VVRPEREAEILRQHGGQTLLYRLSGYVFFGSASRIESVFRTMDATIEAVVVDFTKVTGIDSSAIAVFQRILRRYHGKTITFHLIYGPDNEASLRAIVRDARSRDHIRYYDSLDHAIETAEEDILSRWDHQPGGTAAFAFLDSADDHATFLNYCENRRIRAGETLCAEHDLSDEIFFVVSGSLEVIKETGYRSGTGVRLAKLRAGAVVGELAFYTHEARTASIVAVTDAEIYVLHRSALELLRADAPELALRFDHMVIRRVSHALTRTNKLVALYR
jgi:SulP family sulfate permease